ncbi:unnamed protein product [Oppiella nova]|uniref:UBC core domain-containing protein n=1 Tax=Oppiella nova TaxID=334625 RepID=A0A7R9QJK7_9ACAR|nr:unnamed protein product [Oppiella nova]CAG2167237.1 unnamed protein product [Oppiella nova]
MEDPATLVLKKELKKFNENPSQYFSVGLVNEEDIFVWEVTIFGLRGTPYEGGLFRAHLTFPKDFPISPPKMRFLSDIWHPNIFPDGRDYSGWRPILSVETIVLSVLSMLSESYTDAVANPNAAQ